MKSFIAYVELKTHSGGHDDCGPACICRVSLTKSGRGIRYRGKLLQRGNRGGCGNYIDSETGEVYWVSRPKRNGEDRYGWAQRAPVTIDDDIREEYWTEIRGMPERIKQTTL